MLAAHLALALPLCVCACTWQPSLFVRIDSEQSEQSQAAWLAGIERWEATTGAEWDVVTGEPCAAFSPRCVTAIEGFRNIDDGEPSNGQSKAGVWSVVREDQIQHLSVEDPELVESATGEYADRLRVANAAHELGHLAGLLHAPTPTLMAEVNWTDCIQEWEWNQFCGLHECTRRRLECEP